MTKKLRKWEGKLEEYRWEEIKNETREKHHHTRDVVWLGRRGLNRGRTGCEKSALRVTMK
jgi:hypothetical protein